ncbi:MAG TPA: hypothetical protein V6D13_10605 [Halomicronema sp.]
MLIINGFKFLFLPLDFSRWVEIRRYTNKAVAGYFSYASAN